MNLLEKLLDIQKSIDHFTKDKEGHNYSYVTGEQILGKIRPLMNEKGLLLKQEVISVNNEKTEYETRNGPRAEMFTSVQQLFTWIDVESGEQMEVRWHANGMNDWDKGLGSALTYAERYFLLKFFHVPTDEDDPDTRQDSRAKKATGSDNGKPWLNKTGYKSNELTSEWKAVVKRIKSGQNTTGQIYDYYKVNKENREELEQIEREYQPA